MFSIIFANIGRMAEDYTVVRILTHFQSFFLSRSFEINVLSQQPQQSGQIRVGCENNGCDTGCDLIVSN